MYRNILLAYDGSESGQRALLESQDIAQWSNARLTLVAVVPADTDTLGLGYEYLPAFVIVPEQKKKYQRLLDDGVSHLTSKGFRATGSLLSGDVVSEIANHAKTIKADLIVVGHRQEKSWVQRWWSNSTAKSLVEVAPCSVLMVVVRDR
ncbi:MAG: universal stress protein [Verrucomicrobia bacterium]|nr:universal stress protein [Verrucomicrobiota bacterium]